MIGITLIKIWIWLTPAMICTIIIMKTDMKWSVHFFIVNRVYMIWTTISARHNSFIFVMTFWKVILMVVLYDWKLSSKIQRPHHFKDRIPYTRRYFIQFLSTHVKSSYWFPVSVLKISHYLRLNYLWQVVCYFFHRKILLSFISKIHGFWQFVEFCGEKI